MGAGSWGQWVGDLFMGMGKLIGNKKIAKIARYWLGEGRREGGGRESALGG